MVFNSKTVSSFNQNCPGEKKLKLLSLFNCIPFVAIAVPGERKAQMVLEI